MDEMDSLRGMRANGAAPPGHLRIRYDVYFFLPSEYERKIMLWVCQNVPKYIIDELVHFYIIILGTIQKFCWVCVYISWCFFFFFFLSILYLEYIYVIGYIGCILSKI